MRGLFHRGALYVHMVHRKIRQFSRIDDVYVKFVRRFNKRN